MKGFADEVRFAHLRKAKVRGAGGVRENKDEVIRKQMMVPDTLKSIKFMLSDCFEQTRVVF